MADADLSIVVISWNTRGMTEACLASVFAGTGALEAEVIVVDNASEDGSADMVEERYPRVRLIRNARNMGFAVANNQAIEVARGRHILLLNSDTVVHGAVLPASVAWLDGHPEVGAMGCRVLNTDGTTQPTCHMYPSILNQFLMASGLWKLPWPRFFGRPHMTDWQRDSVREVETISGCYLMVRREVIEQVGPLDEAFFFFGEETDWCKRMRDAGWRLMFSPVGEITHHGGGSVKKLRHERDVMLTQAIVRLHHKHGGRISATFAWTIVTVFNVSRAAYWSSRSLLGAGPHARERAAHFRMVVRNFRNAWPRQKDMY